MRGGRLEMAVLHVVRPRPEDLHRRFGRARNFRRFDRVIDCEPPAESAANQGDVDLDLAPASVPSKSRPVSANEFGAWVGAQIVQRSARTSATQFIVSTRRVGVERIWISRFDRARDRRRCRGRFFFARDDAGLARRDLPDFFACASESNASGGGSSIRLPAPRGL